MKNDVTLSGRRGVSEGGEDEGIRAEVRACGSDPLFDPGTVFREQRNAERVKSNLARASGLGGLLGEPTGHDNQGTGDAHNPELKVNV